MNTSRMTKEEIVAQMAHINDNTYYVVNCDTDRIIAEYPKTEDGLKKAKKHCKSIGAIVKGANKGQPIAFVAERHVVFNSMFSPVYIPRRTK